MWQSRQSQRLNQSRASWHEEPAAPRLGKVLVIVDLDAARPLMNKIMDSTTCDVLPTLSRHEELALFTYNVLVDIHQLETLTVYNLLYSSSDNTSGTRGIATFLRPQWTFAGKIRPEIPLLSTMRTAWSNFFMNSVLIGLKVKNLAFYFQAISDISRLTTSHTSCV